MTETRSWIPRSICCWCGSDFVKREIAHRTAWVCPTTACFDRQMAWVMYDKSGVLFYLPMPKQAELEEAVAAHSAESICLGGSRGGGKSIGIRRIAQRYCQKLENFSVLFLRRTFDELQRNHMKFCPREAHMLGAKYTARKFEFPDHDSTISFAHCDDPDDYANYIGAEFDLIVFDQLEMFTEQQFTEICPSTSRVDREDFPGLVLCGENPGGPLSAFVDELFIAKSRDVEKYPEYDPKDYLFIPSHLEDNPNVSARYIKRLAGLTPERREMYRYGRRDIFPGQFFSQFNAAKHVTAA